MSNQYVGGLKNTVEAKTGKSLESILREFQQRGYSPREAADALGCSVPPIYKYCKRYNIKLANKRYKQDHIAAEFVKPPRDILSRKW